MTGPNRSDDNDLLLALGHPLRRRILRAMEREGGAVSPRELSSALGAPLSNVSYHVRVLADCSAVTLVDTRPARGSLQHFYSIAIDAPWAQYVLGQGGEEDGGPGESSNGTAT